MTTATEPRRHYCASRLQAKRRTTRVIDVGGVPMGGDHPIRVQSMTTTPTLDIDATVQQTLALAEVGCEIVRITAQNKKAAEALGEIARKVRAAGCRVPLVADIHFLPSAAMEAAKHVEKVRVNPGNYADKKKFAVREYSDEDYERELQRLHEAFSPIVLRCRELGRAMRIGTNHGSLSDRIMNRYGDTPLGMVESAMEFIRIAESHGFHNLCLSMKASNPKVMIEAYRLAVARMEEEGMRYPLHLGVTEAGDGEDARIKSAIGIGTLLNDGLGDTIRVSLTEDSVHEIPVARDLADKAEALWARQATLPLPPGISESIDPYTFRRRDSAPRQPGPNVATGGTAVPAVAVKSHLPLAEPSAIVAEVCRTQTELKESGIEGLMLRIAEPADLDGFAQVADALQGAVGFFVLELGENVDLSHLEAHPWPDVKASGITLLQRLSHEDAFYAAELLGFCRDHGFQLAIDCDADTLREHLAPRLAPMAEGHLVLCSGSPAEGCHPLGTYRALVAAADECLPRTPVWIRNTPANTIAPRDYFSDRLLESSILGGALLCDGVGDCLTVETEPNLPKATTLAYNILQGAKSRVSRTEFVACPSCGRTLFDLQEVTRRIRERTGHLRGVTIAVMGCIVNGPGEMADADFGYVGGAPGKINLYVGKECVRYNVPEDEALERLVDLIREHGKWTEPPGP